jgi:hypothetical protein
MLKVCSPARSGFWLLALFLAITLGFAAYRHSNFAVWNDSPGIFHPRENNETGSGWEVEGERLRHAPLATLWACVARSFRSVEGGGYRPLSGLWTNILGVLCYSPTSLPVPLLLLVGALHGALAVAFFAVARRYVRHDLTALGAVGLVLASPPLVASSWVCVAGVQVLVPLLFCLSLLCYRLVVEGRLRVLGWTGLILLLFLGPWVREFFGLNALLLMFLEARRARRPTWLMGIAALGFLHAVFPTALIHWLFVPELALKPVYRLGALSGRIGDHHTRWQDAWHFLPLMPPLLWVCGGGEAVARLFRLNSETATAPDGWIGRLERGARILVIPCWLLLLFAVSIVPPWRPLVGVLFCLGLAALGTNRDLFLGWWFLLMFVPILRVFTEHIHFLYAMLPTAIILAQAAESLWLRLREHPRLVWLGYALAGILAVAGLDQAMNVYGAYRVNHAAYEGIDAVAGWFDQNVPDQAAVVSNAVHGEEIKWHSGNHIQIYWTIGLGINDPRRAVEQPAQLDALLAHSESRPVYFLDVDFDYPPNKATYHRHKYVHYLDIAKRDMGVVHVTEARCPFFDPLRYLIPREYQPFLGAPDLVNDFGRNFSRRQPFAHEVSASYHVYQVTGKHFEMPLEGPVYLEREGEQGFNILRVGVGFHAIPQREGVFDLDRFRRHDYSVQFSGPSLEAVRQQIQAFRTPP